MQEQHVFAEGGGKVILQPLAHIDELGEDQGAIAFREQFLHHFGQTRQLSRAARERRLIPQKLRGMIADLLQFGEGRENDALALDALGGLERARSLFDDAFVERSLLRCQIAEHLHLHFFGRSCMTEVSVLRRLRMNGAVSFLSCSAAPESSPF